MFRDQRVRLLGLTVIVLALVTVIVLLLRREFVKLDVTYAGHVYELSKEETEDLRRKLKVVSWRPGEYLAAESYCLITFHFADGHMVNYSLVRPGRLQNEQGSLLVDQSFTVRLKEILADKQPAGAGPE
jgi:hypothetical protein